MILSEIKRYLQQHKNVNLQDLVLHFQSEPEAMRGMLEHWIRKGKIQKQPASNSRCGRCCECDPSKLEVYEWLG